MTPLGISRVNDAMFHLFFDLTFSYLLLNFDQIPIMFAQAKKEYWTSIIPELLKEER